MVIYKLINIPSSWYIHTIKPSVQLHRLLKVAWPIAVSLFCNLKNKPSASAPILTHNSLWQNGYKWCTILPLSCDWIPHKGKQFCCINLWSTLRDLWRLLHGCQPSATLGETLERLQKEHFWSASQQVTKNCNCEKYYTENWCTHHRWLKGDSYRNHSKAWHWAYCHIWDDKDFGIPENLSLGSPTADWAQTGCMDVYLQVFQWHAAKGNDFVAQIFWLKFSIFPSETHTSDYRQALQSYVSLKI
jgi:hypothetical protein